MAQARKRRWTRTLGVLALALGLVLAAAVIWREALVEAAARRLLAARGLDEARLEVAEVGLSGLALRDVRLGEGLPSARRVRLDYAPRGLLAGRLGTLTISGMTYDAPARLDAALAPLGALDAGAGGGGFSLARVEIEEALVTLPAPAGGTLAIDGALDLSGERPGAALDLALDLGQAMGVLTLRSDALGEGGVAELTGEGTAELAGLALPGLPGAGLTAGTAHFALEGTVRIPALDAGRAALGEDGVVALDGVLRLAGVTSTLDPGVLAADFGWSLGSGDGSLRLFLPRPGRLAVAGISPEGVAALGLSAEGAPRDLEAELASAGPLVAWSPGPGPGGGAGALSAELAVSLGEARAVLGAALRAEHDAGGRLVAPLTGTVGITASDLALAGGAGLVRRLRWTADASFVPAGEVSLEGPLEAEAAGIRTPSLHAAEASAEGAVRLTRGAGGWSVAAPAGLSITVEEAAIPGRLDLASPLGLAIESLDLRLGAETQRLDLVAVASPFSGTFRSGAGEIAAFAEAAGRVELGLALGEAADGVLTLAEAGLVLPGYRVALSDLGASFPLGVGPADVALSGEARDTGRAARFAPLRFALEGRRDGEAVTLAGTAAPLAGSLSLPLEVTADLAAATGRMTVAPTRIAFRRAGLQPGTLIPALAAFRDVEGAVRVRAEFALDAKGALRSGATLDLDDVSGRSGEIEVAGLAGRLRLGRLFPPATAGTQELAARTITAGIPLARPRARFSAEARGQGFRVRIDEAEGSLAGGTVAVAGASWDSAAKTNAFEVRVRDVALGQLLSDWHIEGISGSGRLSGTIPVRLGPAGIVVDGGRLVAAGPGVLQVDFGAARETLVGAGEQVELTVRALEDFHYDSLAIGVSQPADGALTLSVSLEGANPAVLDGYPFRFNVNLSGELAPILDAVREGRRIGAGLLSGGLGGQ